MPTERRATPPRPSLGRGRERGAPGTSSRGQGAERREEGSSSRWGPQAAPYLERWRRVPGRRRDRAAGLPRWRRGSRGGGGSGAAAVRGGSGPGRPVRSVGSGGAGALTTWRGLRTTGRKQAAGLPRRVGCPELPPLFMRCVRSRAPRHRAQCPPPAPAPPAPPPSRARARRE